jgi:cyclopropane fatty-acyl-phospholipid synthase-like methyltransferase
VSIRARIVDQFRRPHGALGHLAGWIMAARGSNRARNTWTVGLLEIGPNDRVLEIGCGPGLGLAEAARQATAGRVVGLDHSETMLGQARARNATAIAAGGVELVLGGLEKVAGLPGPFDKIFSINVVQFLPDRAAAFATLLGKLAPGGTVATTYMPRHRNPTRADAERTAREIADILARAGFASIRIETLDLKPVPAVCVLGRRPAA